VSAQGFFITMFGGGGACALALGAWQLGKSIHLVRSGLRATGIVRGYAEDTQQCENQDGTWTTVTFYHPIVEFTDAQGAPRRVTLDMGTGEKPYAEGGSCPLLYDPAEVEEARIASFSDLWTIGALLTCSGLLGITLALCAWLFDWHVRWR
jgi:uncharacterized protein DUF3592